jgi:capsular exopolysaccharide synthesis family protein
VGFKQFLLVLRRRWLSIVLVFLVGIGTNLGISLTSTRQYESTAKMFLAINVADATSLRAATRFLDFSAQSYADLAESTDLAEQVILVLDLDTTPGELSGRISSDVIEGTSLIEITVTDTDPTRAQEIAAVVSSEFETYAEGLETPSDGKKTQIAVRVADVAKYNPDPIEPMTWLNLLAGGLIGLFLGIALAVARELSDRTVRTAAHITEATAAPILTTVGVDSGIKSAPLLTDLETFAERTEAFRLLRANLQYVDLDERARVLVVTSAVPDEGKTMTAANLAIALAQTGQRVLIVDADLRRPRLAGLLGLDPAIGLTTTLVGKTRVEDATQVHEASGLHLLSSGAKPPNPTEILQSRAAHDLFQLLRQSYDMVIIDAPPVLSVADAAVLATISDGAILVVRHRRTTRDQLADAVHQLHQVGGKVYGVVVNQVVESRSTAALRKEFARGAADYEIDHEPV